MRISRNFEIPAGGDGARPGVSTTLDDVVVTRQPTTPFITRHRLNGRKHATYSPRYYHGGSRGNFGTWHGWEIVSLRGFCLDCWFRSREKWWLLTKTWLPAKKKDLRLYLFGNLNSEKLIVKGENFFFVFYLMIWTLGLV